MNTDYQKINTLFLRDENSIIMPQHFTCAEFEYLQNTQWECTEKIDGTNIHCDVYSEGVDDVRIAICGRTDKAQIPAHLMARLQDIFTIERIKEVFGCQIEDSSSDNPFQVSIYGEGYGAKIQKGGNYISDGVDFILFDVRVGRWWLNREACESIAEQLGVSIVPLIGYMTIIEAIDFVRKGFKSTIAENKDYEAEGLVLKTPCGLISRKGERIITKIKTCDFAKCRAKYGTDAPVEQVVNPHIKQ